ncbi:hypothetical protein GYB22_09275 [bacterium]|nr:hypothetical protein [bacterium]
MTKNTLLLIAVFLGTFSLAFILTNKGCNKASMDKSEAIESADKGLHQDHEITEDNLSVDARIDQALANIKEGRETNDFNLMMQNGVFKLREIEAEDSNNLRAIYHLTLLSMESGQFEKAKNRSKKLLLLQPSNEEYQKLHDEILQKLGEK